MAEKQGVVGSLLWKLMERFGVQTIQFLLQIVLARLLSPDHYGVLALMITFISIANVFIQSGFNTALIQGKEVKDDDFSSVFWLTLGVASLLYIVLFFAAPMIGRFFNMPDFVNKFRVLALVLLPGALNSVQLAKISRAMDFKKVFYSNIGGIVVSGIVGVSLAFMGKGIWALVAQNMTNVIIASIVMWFTVKWRPQFTINFKRLKVLFAFGWKLMASGMMDVLYLEMRGLVIGKKYKKSTLGFYNRGKQFPQFLIDGINGALQSVMLPALSSRQSRTSEVKTLMRNSILMSSYILFPLMALLAGVSEPLIAWLLTDKWLPAAPYMQIYCFTLALFPIHTCNLQAINAIGRSDIFLKLEIIKKILSLLLLVGAIIFFDSPIMIAWTGAISGVLGLFINAWPNKKLVDYSYFEQMKDVGPYFGISCFIFIILILLKRILPLSPLAGWLVLGLLGLGIYILFSLIIKPQAYLLTRSILRASREKMKEGRS